MTRRVRGRLGDEDGAVLVAGLLLSLALMIVIGAGVDIGHAFIVRREERGDSLVNWVVLAVGLAAAAAAVVALLRPAIETAAQKMVNFISGG